MIPAKCPVCGNWFEPFQGRKYCSAKCRLEAARERDREYSRERVVRVSVKPVTKPKKTNDEIIDENVREALRRHISYGKLQAERYVTEMRKKQGRG